MSVEALSKSRTVRRSAMHQVHAPVPLAVLDPANPAQVIDQVIQQVRETQRARQCGSFVFIDKALNVFVIPEERPCALEWVRTRIVDLVAKYQPIPRGAIVGFEPTREALAEDFADFLQQREATA